MVSIYPAVMSTDIAEFKDYRHEIILRREFKPRKSLIYVISGNEMSNGRVELIHQYHVYDKFNKLVLTTNHLCLAIPAYNELS
jgi:hypothetical protein